MDDEEQDNHHHDHHHNNHHHHLLCDNDQRTASMNSFADAHTPSESPEASSSESSAGGDWESGEFKTNDQHIDWPKQRKTSKTKLISNLNKSQTGKQTQQFKAKSNNIKITNNNNRQTVKKMRWLTNMRSDPDFRETLAKSVIIQPRQSIDSLDTDFYSAICDNQLSVGSPCKSPSELLLKNNQLLNKNANGKKQLEKQQQQQLQHQQQLQQQQQHMDKQSLQNSGHTELHSINCSELVIAKPTESQSIGFKLEIDENHASAKHSHDKASLLEQCKLNAKDPSPLKGDDKSLHLISNLSHEPHSDQYKKENQKEQQHSSQLNSSSQNAHDASQSIDSHEKSSYNTKKNSKRKSNEQTFPYRFFHKTTANAAGKSTSALTANTSVVATAVGVTAAAAVSSATVASKPLKLKIYPSNENNNIINGTKNNDSNSSIASASTVSHSIDSASSTCSSSHSSTSSGSSSSASNSNVCVSPLSPSTSIFSISRFNRCSPFTFREFRDELRLVMRQNSTKSNTNGNNNNNNSDKSNNNKQK